MCTSKKSNLDFYKEISLCKSSVSEFVKSLGWEECGFINNRFIYKLGSRRIFIHSGEIGLYNNKKGYFLYKNLSQDVLFFLTKRVKKEMKILENAKKFTAFEYIKTKEYLDQIYYDPYFEESEL